ncbi:MAG: PilZ domain-containing protein [Pseudomonadales bacterium]|nr:PilZ domain-containing protein [Pseudomonadales bacterium]
MRRFVRHPSNMPIDISTMVDGKVNSDYSHKEFTQLDNLSSGGICCKVKHFIPKGTHVNIHIPSVQKDYEGYGVSAWCRNSSTSGYELGIRFDSDNDAFNYHMVEQICLIEEYRQLALSKEGRTISSEEAAIEWIGKFADKFPSSLH